MKTAVRVALLTITGFGAGFAGITFFLNSGKNDAAAEAERQASGDKMKLDWGMLRELNLENGQKSATLEKANGELVEIPGFMVPLEDEATQISEFLLVPSPQACVHVPPPPPNQMVHVKMAPGVRTKVAFGPIWLIGKLQITDFSGPYGVSSFYVTGLSTRPYE